MEKQESKKEIKKEEESKELESPKKEENSKKSRVNKLFKNKDTEFFILIGILLVTFFIRLHYFISVGGQAVWWDEAEYLLQAKHIALGTPNTGWAAYTREPFMPIIWSLFFKIGLGEMAIKFSQILLSVFTVFLTYLVGKELFNKKAALIAASIMAVFHHSIFFSIRALLTTPTLVIWLSSIYFFIRWHKNRNKKIYLFLYTAIAAIGLQVYYSAGFLAIIFLVFLILTEKLEFLKDKNVWKAIIIALLILSPFVIYAYMNQGTILPKLSATLATHSQEEAYGWSEAFSHIKHFNYLLLQPFLIIFLIGFAILLLNLILGFDIIVKQKSKKLNKQLFTFLWILVPMLIFIYIGYNRGAAAVEPRYILPIFPAVFLIIGDTLTKAYDKFKKYHKGALISIIVILILIGGFYQLNTADNLIKGKANGYLELKKAGLWIKENSEKDETVISSAVPQLTYYSERANYGWGPEEELMQKFEDLNTKYMVLTIWEKSPDWAYEYPRKHNDVINVAQAYFLDQEQKNPALAIYEIT